MFVDGGAAVNVMPYTTFKKLGMGLGDLTPTSIVLNDFAGNPSDTKGCVHVDLMIGSKTLLTTFFVIEGKGAYSLLLGKDLSHPIFRRKPSAYLYACQDQVSCI
jgi:hypothetical protein